MELLLRREAYGRVAALLLAEGEVLHAPHLIDAEIAQVLRRFERSGAMTATRGREALTDFLALRIVRHPHPPLLDRVWELRHNLSAYDGLYVTLSEALEAPLVTLDGRLMRAPGHGAEVLVVR